MSQVEQLKQWLVGKGWTEEHASSVIEMQRAIVAELRADEPSSVQVVGWKLLMLEDA